MRSIVVRSCLILVWCALANMPLRADPPIPTGMAGKLIAHYQMQRIAEEGAWYSVLYSSEDFVPGDALPARYEGRTHRAGSAIVLVETVRDFSAMHRLRTDEVWHFYSGSPIHMLLLYPDGRGRKVTLGADVLSGQLPQFTVPRGVWQGSIPEGVGAGAYALAGDQLSPAFDSADFEMGYRDELQRAYPAFSAAIARLTRGPFAHRVSASAPVAAPARTLAQVITPGEIAPQTLAPGVSVRELIGRTASVVSSSNLSIARFDLTPGQGSGLSYSRRSEEAFVILSGSGHVRLGADERAVGPGSIVFIPALVPHVIDADPASALQFLAIETPAFTPEDYVRVAQ
jgi:predicted cupin superfamily sugar epimerase/mannose-6-phosphate isomerase-like protein (cupin superfamily)